MDNAVKRMSLHDRLEGARGLANRVRGGTLTWGLLVFGALLPIGLLSLYAYRITSQSVRDLVQANNVSAGTIAAELVGHDLEQNINLARAIAALPGMIEAVESRDEEAVRAHLRAVVESYQLLDRAFVTDPTGVLWSDYPRAPESLGKNFSQRDWYRGLSRAWKPYVSEVYQRHAEPKPLVVAIAVPIRKEQRVLGALAYQYRLGGITEWLKRIKVGGGGYVFLIDHTGTVAAHPKLDLQARQYKEFRELGPIQQGLEGQPRSAEYFDPLARRTMVASLIPMAVAEQRWVVVAQQPSDEAYAPIYYLRLQLSLAGSILALAALAVVGLGRSSERNRRLNRQLEEQNQRLQQLASIVESSDDAIIGKTLDGTIRSCNAGAERMYGYAPGEVLGRPTSVLIPPNSPNELPRLLEKIKRGEGLEHYETVRLRKDGQEIHVSLTISPIRDAAGNITGASSIARDITERKRAEAALWKTNQELQEMRHYLARLIESSTDAIISTDKEGNVVLFNKGAEAMLGYRREEILGQRVTIVYESEERAKDVMRQMRQHRGAVAGYETALRTKDSALIPVLISASILFDVAGQETGTVGFSKDLRERKRAEEELKVLNAELEAFTYSVSHDLRAPLRHIDGFSKIVAEELGPGLDPTARRYLERVQEGARHMGTLVDNLLNLSRLGRQPLTKHMTNLKSLVQEVLAALKPETDGREIGWQIGQLPTVECDPALMRQVFANLVSNAVKFTRSRQRAVIQIDQMAMDGQLVIFVRDNGVGFSMKYADKLFGVFQRLHRQEEFEGTGVGLATVQRIVRKHGGRMWAEAELDKGATFYFTLGVPEKGETKNITAQGGTA